MCLCQKKVDIDWEVFSVCSKVPQLSEKTKAVEEMLSMSVRCWAGFCFNQIKFFVGHHLAEQDAFQRLAMVSSFAFENVNGFGIAWQELSSSQTP